MEIAMTTVADRVPAPVTGTAGAAAIGPAQATTGRAAAMRMGAGTVVVTGMVVVMGTGTRMVAVIGTGTKGVGMGTGMAAVLGTGTETETRMVVEMGTETEMVVVMGTETGTGMAVVLATGTGTETRMGVETGTGAGMGVVMGTGTKTGVGMGTGVVALAETNVMERGSRRLTRYRKAAQRRRTPRIPLGGLDSKVSRSPV